MTEAGVTIINFNQMSQAIQNYRTTAKRIQEIATVVDGIIKALQAANVFTGGAASTAISAFRTYKQALDAAKANLDKIVDFLQQKLDAYQQAHSAAVNLAGAIQQAQWTEV